MFLKLAAIAISIGILTADNAEAESVSQNGTVSNVTLYRNQARVTRTLVLDGKQGEVEIVVSELPENIVADSLFAEGENEIEVRAVQFRTRAVGQSPRKEVRELQDKIQANQKAIELNQKLAGLLKKKTEYLDKMENFVAPTASAELSKGVLDAEALEKVTVFNFQKREEIVAKEIEFSTQLLDLQSQGRLLNRQLAEITNNGSKTVREAILFIRKNDESKSTLQLSYLVNSCGWSPSYTVRAADEQAFAKLEYNGLIQQLTGENWNNVELTLSTATPAVSSFGPGLAPFSVGLVAGATRQVAIQQQKDDPFLNANRGSGAPYPQNISQLKNMQSEKQQAQQALYNSSSIRDNIGNSWGLNRTVNALSCLALGGGSGAGDQFNSASLDGQEPCLSYQLPNKVTLTSRQSQQMVRIIQSELPGEFYHVATPVLTEYVYREAELNNNGDADFLAGPINVYLNNRFVGRGEIPTVARGQSFVIGFGADSQLRTRREMVEKSNNINGGNREVTVDYRLVVENYKDTAVKVRIADRLPKPVKKRDIRITMLKPKQPLSTDAVYARMDRPLGILRWDAEIPARAIGDKVHEIEYSYSMEFDRKFQVAMATDQSQELMQFEEIQARRMKR